MIKWTVDEWGHIKGDGFQILEMNSGKKDFILMVLDNEGEWRQI